MSEDEEIETKIYRVKITAEWDVEVEAVSEYDAEEIAQEMVEGDHYWGVRPDYIDAWAEEIDGN